MIKVQILDDNKIAGTLAYDEDDISKVIEKGYNVEILLSFDTLVATLATISE